MFKQFKLYIVFSVLIITFRSSSTSILISVLGIFLMMSSKYLLWITVFPVSVMLLMFSLGIKFLITKSLSLAVRYSPSSVSSNNTPFNIGIIFLGEIALITLLKLSKIIFFSINNFIFIPSFFFLLLLLLKMLISLFFSTIMGKIWCVLFVQNFFN